MTTDARRSRSYVRPDDQSPDILVTASIFAGLLAIFSALIMVFGALARESHGGTMTVPEEEGIESLYFGSYTEVALIFEDRVEFHGGPDGAFMVPAAQLPKNPKIMQYLGDIAAEQQGGGDSKRRMLLAARPGSAANYFWMEAMAGDAGVTSIAFAWFSPDCAHIDGRGREGARMMAECLEARQ